jgi:hypothetical protein
MEGEQNFSFPDIIGRLTQPCWPSYDESRHFWQIGVPPYCPVAWVAA